MSNTILLVALFSTVAVLFVVIPVVAFVALKVFNWFSRVNGLLVNMDAYLQADAERMKVLNEAIVKLAVEATASRESVDQVRDLVTSATESSQESLMKKYNSAFDELRGQGLDEREAHSMASEYMSSIGEI